MARIAKSFEEKITEALSGDLSDAQSRYVEWLQNKIDDLNLDIAVEIDPVTLKLVQGFYQEYIKDPDVQAANEERKAVASAKNAERQAKSIERAKALLAKLGYDIAPTSGDDSE